MEVNSSNTCCFNNHSSCKGNIIPIDSISNSKGMELIYDQENGMKLVYSLHDTVKNEFGQSIEMKPLQGIVHKPLYYACEYHKSILFDPINNKPFNESNDHIFLHSYKSFLNSYYTLLMIIELFIPQESNDANFNMKLNETLAKAAETRLEMKRKLEALFISKKFSKLYSYYSIFPKTYPILSSGSFQTSYTYTGQNIEGESPLIIFTLFPEKNNRTICIFSCFSENTNGVRFIKAIRKFNHLQITNLITSLMIAYIENSYISPKIWNRLDLRNKKRLFREIDTNNLEQRIYKKTFWKSRLNFFEEKFF